MDEICSLSHIDEQTVQATLPRTNVWSKCIATSVFNTATNLVKQITICRFQYIYYAGKTLVATHFLVNLIDSFVLILRFASMKFQLSYVTPIPAVIKINIANFVKNENYSLFCFVCLCGP